MDVFTTAVELLGDNWLSRATYGEFGLPPPRADRPIPIAFQTALPADYSVYFPDPGGYPAAEAFASAIDRLARSAHAFDTTELSPFEQSVLRLLKRLGWHAQEFTNFRTGLLVNDNTTVLPYNPLRAYLLILNKGANTVQVAFGKDADAVSGVDIVPGGNYEPIGGTVSDVRAFTTAAAQSLVIVEGFTVWPENLGVG